MYHSITLGAKNTWDDWHLVSSSRPVIATPKQKTNFIDIPGGNGALDFSEALTGYPVYCNREGSLEFIVMNGYQEWNVLYDTILNYLHGQRATLILEDEPEYYYTGRFSVDNWASVKDNSTITINYVLDPYKTHLTTGERRL